MYNIIIVGCGATGSHLITLLSQLSISERRINEIILIDGDTVENKNYCNQKFTSKDLGKNKAEVLAKRYSKLMINISFIDKYLESKEMITDIIKKSFKKFILIGCVDNNKARTVLNDVFNDNDIESLVYIDTGNGEENDRTGQTVIGLKDNKNIIKQPVCSYFPEILKYNDEYEIVEEGYTCSNISEHPQNFATNVLSATTAFIITNNIVCLNKLYKNIYTFDTDMISLK